MDTHQSLLRKCFPVLLFLMGLFSIPQLSAQVPTMIINEMSNGASGLKEFYEFVVMADGANCTVDIRGFIIDDNNGDFSCGPASGVGIATGHGRFSATDITWSAVPVGSMIVLYNPTDRNNDMPVDDPTDSDGDGVYIVPINHPSMESTNASPQGQNACPGTGNAGYSGTYSSGANWSPLGMRNSGDVAQIRTPAGAYVHGLSYGNSTINGGPDNLKIGTSNGGGECYFFTDGDFRDVTNFAQAAVTGNQTPGAANNPLNAAFIASQSCILPVEFERQLAASWQEDQSAQLTWTTSEELNFDRFEVLRADEDHPEFESIASIDATGASSYTYVDQPEANRTTWYRLRLVDLDGSSNMSRVAGLYAEPTDEPLAVDVFPNPATSELNFRFSTEEPSQVLVYDLQGRTVAQQTIEGIATLDVSQWTPGLYFWQSRTGAQTASGKFLVQ